MVHRDIKPDNVMLSGRHARITDFGIARALSEGKGGTITTLFIALGTTAYMSPEQATADPAVDSHIEPALLMPAARRRHVIARFCRSDP